MQQYNDTFSNKTFAALVLNKYSTRGKQIIFLLGQTSSMFLVVLRFTCRYPVYKYMTVNVYLHISM